jgi:Bacterial regulatory helix-turn-helix protein, lysR family
VPGSALQLSAIGHLNSPSTHLHVSDEELAKRRADWQPPKPALEAGYWKLYIDHVLQADEGADLQAATELAAQSGERMASRRSFPSPPIRIPPLNRLEAFEEVARHGSSSKAGEALSITPSAVSHRIAQLELQLGLPLFVRIGHSVSLTAQGGALLEHVGRGLDSLREGITSLGGPPDKTIRLSLPPALASNWLVQRLAEFRRTHPDIT